MTPSGSLEVKLFCPYSKGCQIVLSLALLWVHGGDLLVFSQLLLYLCSCPATSSNTTLEIEITASSYLWFCRSIHSFSPQTLVRHSMNWVLPSRAWIASVCKIDSILVCLELAAHWGRHTKYKNAEPQHYGTHTGEKEGVKRDSER